MPMTFREVLQLTVMRRVWFAQLVSLLGDFLALFAVISVVTYRMHGTPQQVTGVQIAYMLPLALLGPLSGVFVDRWPLKPTLIASDLIRAVLVLLLFVTTSMWQIYVVLCALSCVSSFFAPAQSVTIRSHVPPHGLMSANALMQMAMMGTRVVGPAAAGALVAAFGPSICYAIDFVSFLVSAALIGSVAIVRAISPVRVTPAEESTNSKVHAVFHEMGEGMRFIVHHARDLVRGDGDGGGHVRDGVLRPADRHLRARLAARQGRRLRDRERDGRHRHDARHAGRPAPRPAASPTRRWCSGGWPGSASARCCWARSRSCRRRCSACFTLGFTFAGVIVPAQTLIQQRDAPRVDGAHLEHDDVDRVLRAGASGWCCRGSWPQAFGVRAVFFLCAGLAWVLTGAGKLAARHRAARRLHLVLIRGASPLGLPYTRLSRAAPRGALRVAPALSERSESKGGSLAVLARAAATGHL